MWIFTKKSSENNIKKQKKHPQGCFFVLPSRRVSLPLGEGVTAGDERGIISNPEGRKEKRIATHIFGMLAMTGNVILSAAKNPYSQKRDSQIVSLPRGEGGTPQA